MCEQNHCDLSRLVHEVGEGRAGVGRAVAQAARGVGRHAGGAVPFVIDRRVPQRVEPRHDAVQALLGRHPQDGVAGLRRARRVGRRQRRLPVLLAPGEQDELARPRQPGRRINESGR